MPQPEQLHRDSGQPPGYRLYLAAAAAYLLLCQCGVLLRGIPLALAGYADFRSLYAAGTMIRTGAGRFLYDYAAQEQAQSLVTPLPGVLPFLYPAYGALPFVPLSLLGWRAAYLCFFAVNLLLLWLSVRLMRDSLPHLTRLWSPLPLLLFIGFFPAAEAIMQGQTSILLLTLYCAAFYSLENRSPLRAGLFLGLAIVKMQTALPVALLYVLWRRWRVVAGFLAGATAALLASLCITGPSAFLHYWHSLLLMAASSSGANVQFSIPPAMMPNLYGLTQLLSGGAAWEARAAAAASLLLLLWMATRPPSLPAALVVAILLSRYLGVHDLVLLLLPLAVALNHAAGAPRQPRNLATAAIVGILLLPPLYLVLMGQHHLDWLAFLLLAFLFSLVTLRSPVQSSTC